LGETLWANLLAGLPEAEAMDREEGSAPWLWDRQIAADLAGEEIGDLAMSGHRFHRARHRVPPKRMSAALSLEGAAVATEVGEQAAALHSTTTNS
jgi:hypothetical protein